MTTIRQSILLILACLPLPAAATEFTPGEGVEGKLVATATAGTMIRTESPDSGVLGTLSSARVGMPAGQLGGNTGGNDLNFQKNRPVSTVLKVVVDLELKRQNLGFFARAKAWHDFELEDGSRAYGNFPNGFRQNIPLSDSGFAQAAKFSNVQLSDVYVFGKFNVGDRATLDARAGRQVVNWGASQFVAGGINAINPADNPAQLRPGALPQEGKVPLGMIYANFDSGNAWGADGFVQYEFRPSVTLGCGTFFAATSNAATGCNYVSVLGGAPFNLNDPSAFATSRYPKRNPDVNARDSGQYGLSLRYGATGSNTEFRVYAMNYHSRASSARVTNPNIAGGYGALATTRLTDPNGLKYAALYAEDIKLYGISFITPLNQSMRVFAEIAYRPNQPLNLNASDLIAAFVGRSAASALNRAKNTNAIAPGGTFDGYDRFRVSTASFGANKVFLSTLGSERTILSGEIGWSHVAGLPDPGVLRYGRPDDYGIAAVNGVVCTDITVAKKSCAHEGFVTTNAWGYRLRFSANYPGTFFGAALTPSLAFSHDVDGYSYDGTFLKGRKTLRPGIRADWDKKYFSEIQYTLISDGAYNPLIDRDNLTLVVGANF